MAKTKQDPAMELGPSSGGDENEEQGLVLRVPTAEAIFPAEKESEIRADIAKLVKKYTGFKIESKADYETLKRELSTLVKKRTMVDGTNGWRLSTNRIVNAIGAKILSILEPAETLLASIKKAYDDVEAVKAAAIKAVADKLLADRKNEMFALGAKYDGSAYVLGNVEIYPEDLPGEAYLLKIEKMRAEKVRLDEVAIEAKKDALELQRRNELLLVGASFDEATGRMTLAHLSCWTEHRRNDTDDEWAGWLAKFKECKAGIDANAKKETDRIEQENKALRDQLAALKAEKEKPVDVPPNVGSELNTLTSLLEKADTPVVEAMQAIVETAKGFGESVDQLDDAAKEADENIGLATPVVVDPPTKYERAAEIHQPRIYEQPVAKVDPPAVPAKFQPILLSDLDTTELLHAYQSGAYAFARKAMNHFSQIGRDEWVAFWGEFLASTK
jgi:hypothetical protein